MMGAPVLHILAAGIAMAGCSDSKAVELDQSTPVNARPAELAWDCELKLIRADLPSDRIGGDVSDSAEIYIHLDDPYGSEPAWYALGHITGLVHRAPDLRFDAVNRGSLENPDLGWQIHGIAVRAKIHWDDDRQMHGSIDLYAWLGGNEGPSLDSSDVQMAGNCSRHEFYYDVNPRSPA